MRARFLSAPSSPHSVSYVGLAQVLLSLQFLSLSNETGGGAGGKIPSPPPGFTPARATRPTPTPAATKGGCGPVLIGAQSTALSAAPAGGPSKTRCPTACLYPLPTANGNYPTRGKIVANVPPNAYCSRLKRTLIPKLVVEVGKLSDTSGLFTMRSKKARMVTCWVIM